MNDNLVAALNLLPHGPEFRFLDRLLELQPGRRGAGECTVRGDETISSRPFSRQPDSARRASR